MSGGMLDNFRFRAGWSWYFAIGWGYSDNCVRCARRAWTAPLPPPGDPFERGQEFRTTLYQMCRTDT